MISEEHFGQILVVTLNNPSRRNALGMEMRIALQQAFERAEADPDVRAVVIRGAGDHFCSGADVTGMNVTDTAGARERFRISHTMVRALVKSSKPIVAAVEGWCVGAGMSLALCCDTIVAARDARFMASFGKVGLMGDLGLLHTLPARIGLGRAKQMVIYGDPIQAEQAERIGLVDALAEPGEAYKQAMARAARLAAMASLPIAFTKEFYARGLDASLDIERAFQPALALSDDHREGKAAFLEKRPPRFGGS